MNFKRNDEQILSTMKPELLLTQIAEFLKSIT